MDWVSSVKFASTRAAWGPVLRMKPKTFGFPVAVTSVSDRRKAGVWVRTRIPEGQRDALSSLGDGPVCFVLERQGLAESAVLDQECRRAGRPLPSQGIHVPGLREGSAVSLARVVRDMAHRGIEKTYSPTEARLYEQARGMLGGRGLEHGLIGPGLGVVGQESVEEALRVGLVEVVFLRRPVVVTLRRLDRQ